MSTPLLLAIMMPQVILILCVASGYFERRSHARRVDELLEHSVELDARLNASLGISCMIMQTLSRAEMDAGQTIIAIDSALARQLYADYHYAMTGETVPSQSVGRGG
jgi:hypothetical protein